MTESNNSLWSTKNIERLGLPTVGVLLLGILLWWLLKVVIGNIGASAEEAARFGKEITDALEITNGKSLTLTKVADQHQSLIELFSNILDETKKQTRIDVVRCVDEARTQKTRTECLSML